MNEAFEKILEFIDEQIKIEESIAKSKNEGRPITHQYGANCMNVIKKFVQEVAEEYKGGWIPCSERFPEIDGNTSDTVLVCGSNGFLYMAFWCDDLQWRFCECGMAKEPVLWTEIVAWQPLPEPFKEHD